VLGRKKLTISYCPIGWLRNDKKPFTPEELQEIVIYQRGSDDHNKNLRIKVEIPESYGYTLGDCFIGGASLDWAGQVIDNSATVFLTGIAINGQDPDLPLTSVPCKNLWGTREPDGKGVLGPVQHLSTPSVEAPKAPKGDEE
jgi:hypothetical protein